jgi:uncharacterized cysteine cluster protein YcgN (CxxCxxCC family)
MTGPPSPKKPFWRVKALDEMSKEEWESLCDGCARCCLNKLEDDDSGEIEYTNVACRLLDTTSCTCTNYAERQRFVPDCVILTPKSVAEIKWLPSTCAYRILADGGDLPPWHPLLSGDPKSVVTAGISVAGKVVSEREAGDLEDHVVAWPA